MRTMFSTILASACAIGEATLLALPVSARAGESSLAESSDCVYSVDTLCSPRNIKTADDRSALCLR